MREESCVCLAFDNQLLVVRGKQVEHFWLNVLYPFDEGCALIKFVQLEITLEQGDQHLKGVLFADLLK